MLSRYYLHSSQQRLHYFWQPDSSLLQVPPFSQPKYCWCAITSKVHEMVLGIQLVSSVLPTTMLHLLELYSQVWYSKIQLVIFTTLGGRLKLQREVQHKRLGREKHAMALLTNFLPVLLIKEGFRHF